jgi:SAM-dependent methyltransferase
LKRTELPQGAALDLGCGDGMISRYLAERFRPSLGVDFALGAIQKATTDARDAGSPARFAVADVTKPPFPDGSFAFLFDRGCFHTLPRPLRAPYFEAMSRLLQPNGVLLLMAARDLQRKGLSRRAVRHRIGRLLGRSGSADGQGHWPQEAQILRLASDGFTLEESGREKFPNPLGTVTFNRFVFRKRS